MDEYREYESVIWDLPTEKGTCECCGTEDDILVSMYSTDCRWCRELKNLRHHRWQEAARMQRGIKWMTEHRALGRVA